MPKYIITWDIGYGEEAEVVEADSYDEALNDAYGQAKQQFEENASYDAIEYSQELAEDYGLE